MDLLREHEPVLVNRDLARPAPIPELRIRGLTSNLSAISKRDSSDGSQTSGGSDTTPIVIGVVVPVIIIAIILFVIWQRRRKITRHEEAHDKYKSLDFGVDLSSATEKKGRKNKNPPEMSIADIKNTLRKDRGLSLDLGATNPYLLPPEVQQSRESLHSLSRTGDDKYRATTFIPNDGSLRSPSIRSGNDGSSIFSGSTRNRAGTMDTDRDLLPRLPPKRDGSETPSIRKPLPVANKPQNGLLAPTIPELDRNSTISTASDNVNFAAMRASNNYLGQYIRGGQKEQPVEKKQGEQPGLIVSENEVQVTPPADRLRELPAVVVHDELSNTQRRSSHYGTHGVAELASPELAGTHYHQQATLPQIETTSFEMDATQQSQFPKRTQSKRLAQQHNQETDENTPPVPQLNVPQQQHDQPRNSQYADDASDYYEEEGYEYGDYADYVDYTYRNSTVGVRPLPPDDPSENPEQRANRIRSFYKEYFDDSSPANHARASPANYYDGSEQYEQYDDFDYGYYEQSHSRGQSIRSDMPGPPRGRAHTQGSYSSHAPGPRAYSSMSGRPQQRRPPPKKKLPPPKPLQVLPTPAKLKDDDFMLANLSDFAPPQVFKNQRSGTPDSLRGGLRPYSPSIKPHVPLNSSFDDLAVVPSP